MSTHPSPQTAGSVSELPPPELTWLYTHCRAIGMTCKSDSGKWEHDISLFTTLQKQRIDELERELAARSAPKAAPHNQPAGEAEQRSVEQHWYRANGDQEWIPCTGAEADELSKQTLRYEFKMIRNAALASSPSAAPAGKQPELTVWYGPMPESNGKSNFTATLMRKGADFFDTDQFTFARSEYPDRVRYEADFMRYLIGERTERPELWDKEYDHDKHSGYVSPASGICDTTADHIGDVNKMVPTAGNASRGDVPNNPPAGEILRLRQGLWDVYGILGFDTDGDKTPSALVGDIVALVVEAAKELRRDYDEALVSPWYEPICQQCASSPRQESAAQPEQGSDEWRDGVTRGRTGSVFETPTDQVAAAADNLFPAAK